MKDDVFQRTLDELRENKSLFSQVIITGLGEPMLDPKIFERAEAIKREGFHLMVYTNGTGDLNELAEVADKIFLSLNAVRSESRLALMGMDGIERLDSLILNWNHPKCKLAVNFKFGWGLIEQQDLTYAKKRWADKVLFFPVANWAGKLFPLRIPPVYPCDRPKVILHLLADGRYALCCFDADGEIILGNTMQEALDSEKRKEYCAKDRKDLYPCRYCTTD